MNYLHITTNFFYHIMNRIDKQSRHRNRILKVIWGVPNPSVNECNVMQDSERGKGIEYSHSLPQQSSVSTPDSLSNIGVRTCLINRATTRSPLVANKILGSEHAYKSSYKASPCGHVVSQWSIRAPKITNCQTTVHVTTNAPWAYADNKSEKGWAIFCMNMK